MTNSRLLVCLPVLTVVAIFGAVGSVAAQGTAAHWRMETGSGSVAVDLGPNGLDGDLDPLVLWSAAIPVSPVPQTDFGNTGSLDLNWQSPSSGGFVTMDDPSARLSPGAGSFTFEAWVRLDALGSTASVDERQWLAEKKPASSAGTQLDFGLLVQAGPLGSTGRELAFRFGDTVTSSTVLSALEINDLAWHHVSIAYDAVGQELRFGLDGSFDTVAFTKPDATNSGSLVLGAHENAAGAKNQFLRGSIDEARYTSSFLDPTQLLDAPALDCDSSGTPDFVEWLLGLVADCNGNFVPDGCDLAAGTSEDCQPDGIPDECQIVDDFYKWHTDDDDASVASDGIYTAWLDSHSVQAGVSTITHVDVWLGGGFGGVGADMTVYLWSDPNGDMDPTDAQVLASVPTTITAAMTNGQPIRFDVPDVFIGPDGTRFFVGAVMETPNASAAQYDLKPNVPGVGWIIGRDSPIDPDDLSAAAVEFALVENALPEGNWCLSAVVEATETDCNKNGVPDACDIASGASNDVDGNGVPDECEFPGIFHVPDDYPTIQSAIDTVLDGSTIIARSGLYAENIDFLGKALVVRSESGPGATVLDGGANGSVVSFISGEGPDSVIRGFTITNGLNTDGGGVRCSGSSPLIADNIITLNVAFNAGGGVSCDGASEAIIRDNLITQNIASSGGGGIGVGVANTSPRIERNRIVGNMTDGLGGGVYASNGGHVIRWNVFDGNSGESGGGLFLTFSGAVPTQVVGNRFEDNSATDDGGGAWVANATVVMANNLFEGNDAPVGGGLYLRDAATLANNTLVSNTATSEGGGLYYDSTGSFSMANSIVRLNTAPATPDLFVEVGATPTITYSNVQGGWAGTGNIDVPAQFVNPAGDDYQLGPGSPCIDAGDVGSLPADGADIDCDGNEGERLPVDLAGRERRHDDPAVIDTGAGAAPVVDMGAYEAGAPRPSFLDPAPGGPGTLRGRTGKGGPAPSPTGPGLVGPVPPNLPCCCGPL